MALSPVTDPAQPLEVAPARVVATKIFVSGLRIEAQIGVYAHERGRTQPLILDVELDAAIAGPGLVHERHPQRAGVLPRRLRPVRRRRVR